MAGNNDRKDFMENLKPGIADNLNKNYELMGKNYGASFAELSGRDLAKVSENSGAGIVNDKKLVLK